MLYEMQLEWQEGRAFCVDEMGTAYLVNLLPAKFGDIPLDKWAGGLVVALEEQEYLARFELPLTAWRLTHQGMRRLTGV